MATYLIRRILLMLPTLLGMTAVVFFIMAAAPGDVAELLISREGEMRAGDRQARLEYIRQRFGLDQPAPVQYLRWLNKVSPLGFWTVSSEPTSAGDVLRSFRGSPSISPAPSRGGGWGIPLGRDREGRWRYFGLKAPDLGHSFVKNRPVLDLIAQALPVTLLLNLISTPLIYFLAIFSGVYAARYRGRWFDTISGLVLLALWSVPTIWAGVLLQGFLANRQYLQWFPSTGLHDLRAETMPFLPHWSAEGFSPGWLGDLIWHLVLPVICLSYGGLAFLAKLSRSAVLENLQADFVRTARAKGLADRQVLWQHAFRNSLLPLITVAAHIIPGLLAGSVIVETIFSIPGMGKLIVDAIGFKDQEVVMAVTLVSGILTLLAYLLADFLYALADPRVSYE